MQFKSIRAIPNEKIQFLFRISATENANFSFHHRDLQTVVDLIDLGFWGFLELWRKVEDKECEETKKNGFFFF